MVNGYDPGARVKHLQHSQMKHHRVAASAQMLPGARSEAERAAKQEEAGRRPLRVLVLSHMHPGVSRGGAEIAAYQLYRQLKAQSSVDAWFVAASGGKVQERLGARFVQPFGPDEYVYCGVGFDHFVHANPDPLFPKAVTELLTELQPDVVHLHHYTNFGVEVFLHIRKALPQARIVVTLHEYLAICNHFGQMVKRPSFFPCYKASPRDCARCFPERSEIDFFLRELYLKRFFRLVDHFISPSEFLAQRYVEWGLPAHAVSVIENGMPEALSGPASTAAEAQDGGLVLGFFGQISQLKGIGVIIEAATLLDEEGVTGIQFDIHGDYSGQPPAFREEFERQLEKAPPNFRYIGPYDNTRVRTLMHSVHAVLVPSIWWENSPLVIQEALAAGRPLIVSDIGGMAEKVRDGLDGFHFRAGNARSLAALAKTLMKEPKRLRRLEATLAIPPTVKDTAAATLSLYQRLIPDTAHQ
jgi:glycosyltransferase involved in cell wall biosynthesis